MLDSKSCSDMALGCALIALNGAWWLNKLHYIDVVLTTVSILCGTIIGLHGVYKITRGNKS